MITPEACQWPWTAGVDVWYVIPIADLKKTRGIHLFPTSKRRHSKYEKYRDAWWHLEK